VSLHPSLHSHCSRLPRLLGWPRTVAGQDSFPGAIAFPWATRASTRRSPSRVFRDEFAFSISRHSRLSAVRSEAARKSAHRKRGRAGIIVTFTTVGAQADTMPSPPSRPRPQTSSSKAHRSFTTGSSAGSGCEPRANSESYRSSLRKGKFPAAISAARVSMCVRIHRCPGSASSRRCQT
jgi:hypothetical protein